MDTHKKIAGVLFIVTGVLHIIGYLFVSAFFAFLFPRILEEARGDEGAWILEWVGQFGQLIGIIIVFFLAIPSIIAGIGLLAKQKWALTMALIIACFKLFSFPIGTAIGIYVIWIFVQNQKETQTT